MGYGEEIMALGRAEAIYDILGYPVAICGVSKHPRKHVVWENHPAVDHTSRFRMMDGPSERPYMIRWRHPGPVTEFNLEYRARAGRMRLTDEELQTAQELTPEGLFAIVEPIIRGRSSKNKDWGFDKWNKVVKNFSISVYQFQVDRETKILPNAKPLEAPSFRIAAGIVKNAVLVMTNDGGMHHMAASVEVPAVVIFGGFANPKITGYPYHHNFYVAGPESPCGRYEPCQHCKQAMTSILVKDVRAAALSIVRKQLNKEKTNGSANNSNSR